MTSTYKQLLQDFKMGLVEGETPVQEMLHQRFGAVCKNVGKERLGWDLQVVAIDGEQIGVGKDTFDEEKLLKKFGLQFGKTFEVKRDKTSDKTGNVYWECWSNLRLNNAGCMLECKADTVVFVRKTEFIFLNRATFLSWIFDNLFMRTRLSTQWRQKTFRTGKQKMISARNNPDVMGILMPVEHVRNSPACFHVEKR